MPWLLLGALLLGLVFGPQWWARWVFKRYSRPRPDLPGTGGELAHHLVAQLGLTGVGVEQTDAGDHFDPEARMVRLSPDNFSGRSLTAVAVAAHEVGHALQHHRQERTLALRTRLVQVAQQAQRAGALLLVALPVVMAITRTPGCPNHGAVGTGSMAAATVVHFVTLPVEWDASFGKALPILRSGYLAPADEPAVRRVLRAAALTYVAASLASLLNLWRWLALLRR